MFQVLDSQPDFYVVNKLAGVGFHQDDTQATSLIDELRQTLKDDAIWPIHRLDKVTSGLVLFARSAEAASAFGERFRQHQIQKYYLAISDKKPNKKQGLIVGDMEKGRGGAYRLLPTRTQAAVTQFFSQSICPNIRLFILKPHTGKTHQLRVAMKSLGAAILGDRLYSGTASDRTYLHAYQLDFVLNGQAYSYQCLPEQGEIFAMAVTQAAIQSLGDLNQLAWPSIKIQPSAVN